MDDESRLAAVETRLRAILDPYRDRLEEGQIYGVPVLRRPGAKAHDWFAGVQLAGEMVKFNLLPMHGHPEILDDVSAALRRHKTGASVLKFADIDESIMEELEALVVRAYDAYVTASR